MCPSYNTCQHTVFSLGKKKLLIVIGYTDSCYTQFNAYDDNGNKRKTTEAFILNPKAEVNNPERWIRYKFRQICILPFKINYCWGESNRVFTIKPSLWIRVKKVREKH